MLIWKTYKIPLTFFFLFLISYGYFYQGGGHNDAARFDSIRSILENHTTWIDLYAYNTGDAISNNGHIYSSKAPGTSLLGLIPFAISKFILNLFPISQDLFYHLVCYLTGVFTVGLISALGCTFLYLFLFRVSKNQPQASILTLTYAFGTLAFPFSTVFFSHQLAAALLFISFYAVFTVKDDLTKGESKSFHCKLLAAGGLAGGLSFTSEYPAALALGWICLYAFVLFYKKKLWKELGIFSFFIIVGIAPLPIYNYFAFHKIFTLSYEAYKNTEVKAFKEMAIGFFGIRNPLSNPLFFKNLAEITIKPQRGILFFSPIVILVIPGFILGFMKKEWRVELWLSLAVIISYLALNASYGNSIVYWGGGYSFGPRHLIPALPFIALPLLFTIQNRIARLIFYCLAVVSCFFCFAGTVVDPKVAYTPENPIVQEIIPGFTTAHFNSQIDGIFSNTLITNDSIAFNWEGS